MNIAIFGDGMSDADFYVDSKINKEYPDKDCNLVHHYNKLPGGTSLMVALLGFYGMKDGEDNRVKVFSITPWDDGFKRERYYDRGTGEYLFRVDTDDWASVSTSAFMSCIDSCAEYISKSDVVVFSDYGIGGAIAPVRDLVYSIIADDAIVYSSGRDRIDQRANYTVLNQREFSHLLISKDGSHPVTYPYRTIIVTKGGEGATVYGTDVDGVLEIDQELKCTIDPSSVRSIVGAGDAYLAALVATDDPVQANDMAQSFVQLSRQELWVRLVGSVE